MLADPLRTVRYYLSVVHLTDFAGSTLPVRDDVWSSYSKNLSTPATSPFVTLGNKGMGGWELREAG